jgi:large subunit ribosomal protein L23
MIIIERPIITEKSLAMAATGVYTFAVADKTTKTEIGKAVENAYKVDVTGVRVLSVKGHVVRRKTGLGKQRDWKKALVTVKSGQTIKDFAFEAETAKKDDKK